MAPARRDLSYRVLVGDQVRHVLSTLDDKSVRILKAHLAKLVAPWPGRGSGDKERLAVRGEEIFRMHVGRRWTFFYVIVGLEVRVFELLPIDRAHKLYG